MSTAADTDADHAAWRPSVNPWLVAVAVMLATILEVLDTSVANVALEHIAGSLSASTDEATWVLTSYLVSNAIVLPMTGYLSGLVGRKRFLLACVGAVHAGLGAVRGGAHPGSARAGPRYPGCGGRGLAAALAGHPPGKLPARQTRPGHGHLRHGSCRGAHRRARPGRLDHRRVFLALGVLHQYPPGRAVAHALPGVSGRPALPAGGPRAPRRARRLHRFRRDGPRAGHPAGDSRPRTDRRLAQRPLDLRGLGRLAVLDDRLRRVGAAAGPPAGRSARVAEPQLRPGNDNDNGGGRRAVQHHRYCRYSCRV